MVTEEVEHRLRGREQRASILISFILVLLGVGVIAAGADDLKRGEEDMEQLQAIVAISFLSVLIFGILSGTCCV